MKDLIKLVVVSTTLVGSPALLAQFEYDDEYEQETLPIDGDFRDRYRRPAPPPPKKKSRVEKSTNRLKKAITDKVDQHLDDVISEEEKRVNKRLENMFQGRPSPLPGFSRPTTSGHGRPCVLLLDRPALPN